MDDDRVPDEAVVGGHPRRREVVEPRHDGAGRAVGDDGQAAERAVAVEVDEEIELGCGDAVGCLLVVESPDRDERVARIRPVPRRRAVRFCRLREEVDCEAACGRAR